mgnify:CR=1 FL=1
MSSATSEGVKLTRNQALSLYRTLFGDAARAEATALHEPWRGMAVRLLKADVGERYPLWETLLEGLTGPERDELIRALGGVAGAASPPPPPAPTPRAEPPGGPARHALRIYRGCSFGGEVIVDHAKLQHQPEPAPRAPVEVKIENPAPAEEARVLPMPGAIGWPEPMGPAAWSGFAGQVVGQIAPTTEADPTAILIQFLAGFGNLVGRGPFVRVDGHDHRANLFTVIVGDTSRARKGTSWRRVHRVLSGCDPSWAATRTSGGLSSGEGLIWEVRDPVYGLDKKGDEVLTDRGTADKRLLVVESEFGGAIRVLGREGSTLSAILRRAYDGEDLRFMTKNNPAVATAPHISLCGHVTREELARHLSSVEAFNGLGNRILWTCSRRSQSLPFGGDADPGVLEALSAYLTGLADDAREAGRIAWAPSGSRLWRDRYDDLTTAAPGLLGAVTSRAEAHALRLALIYALLDRSREIAEDHVLAALAVWRYCADSAAFLFGEISTDARTNAVVEALAKSPDGLSRNDILKGVFNGHVSSRDLGRLLDSLVADGSIRRETRETRGRHAQWYFA